MRIKVEGLSDALVVLSAQEPIADFPALVDVQKAGECTFLEPLQLDFTIEKEFRQIRVHAHVSTKVRLACSRCLTAFDTDLECDFTVFYSNATEMPIEEEVSLT
ncbi:MAG: DUF177 domain-containing protein, partial [Geobacteraceae bacterium]|nr:DUF177 domain-containing protein [Geobacteraceae bacterium]